MWAGVGVGSVWCVSVYGVGCECVWCVMACGV